MTSGAWNPYAGLPGWIQVWFAIVLGLILLTLVQLVVLRVNAARTPPSRATAEGTGEEPADESDFLWVFVVPALNEEVTILDSVSRLQQVSATHKVVLVVDDGSDDATPDLLASVADPSVRVLRRDLPWARSGKAAVLNEAWRHVHQTLLAGPIHRHWAPEDVVVVIVDADGRLAPGSPAQVAQHFVDPQVGGVQLLVRIYNRERLLARAQDVEFSLFGLVFQRGRSWWGTAHMGGNGQFNRLSALDGVATTEGPWRHRLTEDQDIGLRLLQAGWHGRQEIGAAVDQQGLPALRPLLRQRTRWAQGGWQALALLPTTWRARIRVLARLDLLLYLLMPILQVIVFLALLASISLWIWGGVVFWTAAWPVVAFFLGTTAGPALIALLARGSGLRGVVVALLLVLPYTAYAWLTFPAILRALGRQVVGRGRWAKTARQPLEARPPSGGSDGVL